MPPAMLVITELEYAAPTVACGSGSGATKVMVLGGVCVEVKSFAAALAAPIVMTSAGENEKPDSEADTEYVPLARPKKP